MWIRDKQRGHDKSKQIKGGAHVVEHKAGARNQQNETDLMALMAPIA